jgi:hypothetical protein
MTHRALSTTVDRTFGALGLFLMLIVAGLADRGYAPQQTMSGRLSGLLARRAVDGVAIIGWLVDRLPLPAAPHVAAPAERSTYVLASSGTVVRP